MKRFVVCAVLWSWCNFAFADGATLIPSPYSPGQIVYCGPPERRQVALTFDDGPSEIFTPRVLDILDAHNVKATFFVLGMFAKRHPELIREIAKRGHLLASHSWNHPKHADKNHWRMQIANTRKLLSSIVATRPPQYYRPPHGIVTPEVQHLAAELKEVIVLYTLLSSDWQQIGAQALEDQVSLRLHEGGIVVLHDGGKHREQTAEALPGIITRLRARGLEPVRLDTLLSTKAYSQKQCKAGWRTAK